MRKDCGHEQKRDSAHQVEERGDVSRAILCLPPVLVLRAMIPSVTTLTPPRADAGPEVITLSALTEAISRPSTISFVFDVRIVWIAASECRYEMNAVVFRRPKWPPTAVCLSARFAVDGRNAWIGPVVPSSPSVAMFADAPWPCLELRNDFRHSFFHRK
jgi:hypothetical protein